MAAGFKHRALLFCCNRSLHAWNVEQAKPSKEKNWSPVSYAVCFLQVLFWLINTVTPCQTSAWRVSRLRWTISQTKCAKCCGPRTPGTPAWLPRQVLYRNVLSCRAFLHLCTSQTAVELWQLKELLVLSPGKQKSDIYLSHHSRNSCSIAQVSVHLMLKYLEGHSIFSHLSLKSY